MRVIRTGEDPKQIHVMLRTWMSESGDSDPPNTCYYQAFVYGIRSEDILAKGRVAEDVRGAYASLLGMTTMRADEEFGDLIDDTDEIKSEMDGY